MSKIEVNAIEPQCGTNLTVGASGDTITFPSGTTVVNNGSQTGFGRTGTVDWDTTAKTASFTAVSGNGYFVNTTSGAVTMTLPATPSAGDIVSVKDYAGTFATNNLTIARNGSNLDGNAGDKVVSTNNQNFTMVYVDGTQGWIATGSGSDTLGQVPEYISATGGTITCCGNYKIHTFTGPGTFTVCSVGNPLGSDTVDYLVVAGGGAGGYNASGGGGAGGYRESSGTASGCYTASPLGVCVSALPVSASPYPITVGGGGAGGGTPTSNPGNNSIFSTITSTGGGGGGNHPAMPAGANGGSGGGGFAPGGVGGSGNTPPVSPPQGQDGGDSAAPNAGNAGGGGAGAAGSNAPGPGAGPGGNGVTSSINGTPTARGGGGGGGNDQPGPFGTGGTGGGGDGGQRCGSSPTPGTINTGGGGGGAGVSVNGGNGGSGIVIIRYKFQ
jgi:hypothetical protein